MEHVKYKFPERENTGDVIHFKGILEGTGTLCGLYDQGMYPQDEYDVEDMQQTITTKKKVTCPDCINLVKMCKAVRSTEISKTTPNA